MKALTIWQPWASLIIAGAKPYEFRGWRPPTSIIGQRIVIHAAARKIDRGEAEMLSDIFRFRKVNEHARLAAAETCLNPDLAMPILARAIYPHTCGGPLPISAGLGTAIIGEPRLGTEIAEEFGVPRANDSDHDQHANWGWPMLDIEAWPEPIPMRGAQGLWNWPTPEQLVQ
ncbi:MAG: hypothetical protein ABS48_01655 [Erythrobacter sp. SCN 68-10]|nr:MAG: hypothetical protein ABS48_01655 [Erythrobacter sp. SCN 68-10]